jgi:hypothetical protein
MAHKVVAHYIDGRIAKGVSVDVDAKNPVCHIAAAEQAKVEVKLADLKALFFVKDLAGDPKREETKALDPGDPRAHGAHPIELEFPDGERIVGLTIRYPPIGRFFFVLPADNTSNNLRILVNRAAVKAMRGGPPPAPAA